MSDPLPVYPAPRSSSSDACENRSGRTTEPRRGRVSRAAEDGEGEEGGVDRGAGGLLYGAASHLGDSGSSAAVVGSSRAKVCFVISH